MPIPQYGSCLAPEISPIHRKSLRGKWRATLDDITTAQDFIAKVASVSSTTGQPYRIRFPDGHEVLSGDYLRTVLQQFEQPSTS